MAWLHSRFLFIHKLQSLLARDDINGTGLATEAYAIALLCNVEHLRSECCTDELAVSFFRYGLEHLGHGGSVLGVKISVDFIKEVKRCRVASLDREDKGKRA